METAGTFPWTVNSQLLSAALQQQLQQEARLAKTKRPEWTFVSLCAQLLHSSLSVFLFLSACLSDNLSPPPDFSRRKKVRFRWNCDAIKGARVTPTQLRRNNRPTAGASGWHSTSEQKNPIPKWGRCGAANAKNRREVRKNASIGGTKEEKNYCLARLRADPTKNRARSEHWDSCTD